MNRDDVIRMAREAGMEQDGDNFFSPSHEEIDVHITDLERFAALVAAHVRETEFKPDWNKYQQGLADGAAAEREAIKQVAEREMRNTNMLLSMPPKSSAAWNILQAINARGQA